MTDLSAAIPGPIPGAASAPRGATMTAFLEFSAFYVRIIPDRESGWLVLCRDHDWLLGSRSEASANAAQIARGYAVLDRSGAAR
jgi:hypothetical protein